MNIFRRFVYLVVAVSFLGLISFFPGPLQATNPSQVALAASDPVIAAAGDIACDPTNSSFNSGAGSSGSCRQKYTSDLLVNGGFAAILPLGDNQYYCGGYQAYVQSYNLSWGRVKSITRPVVGNHEYLTSGGTDCTTANSGATGYFNYFGSAAGNRGQGYYSYDIGSWHLIALNSNCSDAGGCGSTSPQGQWLAADLAAHQNFCTLAYWHIPVFSSGGRASSNMKSIWQTLYNNNVDLVLSGHDHIYERFAPQTADGVLDTARGIRSFIVGSGGANHTSLATIFPNSEVRNVDTYGILKLTLHPTSFDWQFVPEAGKSFNDSGTGNCHGTTSGNTPTTAPTSTPTRTPTSTLTPAVSSTPTPGPSPTRTSTVTNTAIVTPSSSATPSLTPSSTPVLPASPTSAIATFTFGVGADARVKQAAPTTNYGTLAYVSVDGAPDPIEESYLQFSVAGLSGPVQSARLRVFVSTDGTANGPAVYLASNAWTESAVTWNTKPALLSAAFDNKGALTPNTWVDYDVTPLLSGNGTYTFALIADSTDGATFSSRESTAPAQLLISAATATSTFTPSATVTSTLTATQTATATATLTQTASATSTWTATATAVPSPTFTRTSTSTATSTATSTSTLTPTASATATSTATNTSTSTATFTRTSTATNTSTATVTATPQPSATLTSTRTPSATSIATNTTTSTATVTLPSSPTQTATVTQTLTATLTATHTSTSTITPSSVPSPTSTDTATQTLPSPATATSTLTPSPTATETSVAPPPTDTATLTATAMQTPSLEPSPTITESPTPIIAGTDTALPSETATVDASLTPTEPIPATDTETSTSTPGLPATETPTLESSPTPSETLSPTAPIPASDTPTVTPSSSPTASATVTATQTTAATATAVPSSTATQTATATATATLTASATSTRTASLTFTPSPSPTASSTPSPIPTATRTLTPTITNTPAPVSFVFAPSADTYANESSPTTNYGTATQFRVDGSPIVLTYIRFNVQGLSGTITRVRLRVFANSSSSSGYTVTTVADTTWGETTLTYNNAPPIGTSVGSSGAFGTGVWTTVDLTALVKGNGTLSLALTTSGSTAVSLASREAGANAPQLIVDTIR